MKPRRKLTFKIEIQQLCVSSDCYWGIRPQKTDLSTVWVLGPPLPVTRISILLTFQGVIWEPQIQRFPCFYPPYSPGDPGKNPVPQGCTGGILAFSLTF